MRALFLCLIIFQKFYISASISSGFRFKVIPRDFPGSPLYPGNLTQIERIRRLVQFTQAKASYVHSLSTARNATLNPDNIVIPMIRDQVYYVGAIRTGTPPTSLLLMIDTGGGQIWTQCQPCKNCFHQQYPIYNSQTSSTYQKLPCSHPFCSGGNQLYNCVDDECVYTTMYLSGGSTSGVVSLESFGFYSFDRGPGIAASNVIFGCSNDNHNFEFSQRGLISGILGLSLSPDSLVSQFGDHINKRFSYCMAPFAQSLPNPLLFRFGDDIPPHSEDIQTTPFSIIPNVYYYMLNLLDISINLDRLNFPPGTFRTVPGGTTERFFIDSGAPLTTIDQHTNGVNAYAKLMETLQEHYDDQELERKHVADFDLCYNDKPGEWPHPTITFHFEGADYLVQSEYVTIHFGDEGGFFCMAIAAGHGVSILGAYHQQNMRIIYDGGINLIQFYPDNCAADISSP